MEKPCERLRAHIVERLDQRKHASPLVTNSPAALLDIVYKFLRTRFRSGVHLARMIADHHELLDLLSDNQRMALAAYDQRNRVLIAGHAGTGKTCLAALQAMRVKKLQAAARVILVTHTRKVANQIRSSMLLPESGVEVHHFHGFAASAGVNVPSEFGENWYSEVAPRGLREAVTTGKLERYDAIFVDEAQDFKPSCLDALESLLRDSKSRFWCLYDPMQDIFHIGGELHKRFGDPVWLECNWRNTRSICKHLKDMAPTELANMSPGETGIEGVPPQIVKYGSHSDQYRKLEGLVKQFVHDYDIKPSQIVLLSPFRKETTCLNNKKQVAGYPLVEFDGNPYPDTQPPCIRYDTIAGFKGCEADCIIVHGIAGTGPAVQLKPLYVASSRPTTHLVLLVHEGYTSPFPLRPGG